LRALYEAGCDSELTHREIGILLEQHSRGGHERIPLASCVLGEVTGELIEKRLLVAAELVAVPG
jgi:hypothetical protein